MGKAKAVDPEIPEGFTVVYPTYHRSSGDLTVAHFSDGEYVVTAKGTAIPDDLADHLIQIDAVTKTAPKKE